MQSTSEKNTFFMEKHRKINTMIARTTNGCRYSSHVVTVDIVPSRANPPGGANMLDKHDEVLQQWSSKALAMGPELRRACLIEYAVTSVVATQQRSNWDNARAEWQLYVKTATATATHCPTRTNRQKLQPACQNYIKRQYPAHLCLTEALIVTSPLETSMPAADEFTTTNPVAWRRAPWWTAMRTEFALQSWM